LIGATTGHLGCSLYLREIEGREEGPPPPVDLAAERANGDFVRARIAAGELSACHDLSDGGLLIALAEMALAGNVGASITLPGDVPPHAFCFGEDQGRYLVTLAKPKADALLAAARKAGIPVAILGETGGNALTLAGGNTISLSKLRAAHEGFLPGLMNG
jgi:phosphoribosylformylglycinamidine synthase